MCHLFEVAPELMCSFGMGRIFVELFRSRTFMYTNAFFICNPFYHITLMAGESDFPCTHPGCHRTFKRLNNRTQHYNAQHRPLSPDSEPDPAHQFQTKYHPKLNGMCQIYIVGR